jgi:L-lactate dehydrogenase complex protein LldG
MEKKRSDSSRERILKAVRSVQLRTAAVSTHYDEGAIYFHPDNMLDEFLKEVEAVSGQCKVVLSTADLERQLVDLIVRNGWDYIYTSDSAISDRLNHCGINAGSDRDRFETMQVAITPCEALVARTGSVVMSSAQHLGRQLYAFAPVHIVIAREDQLVAYPEEALELLQQRYGEAMPAAISFVTGPSRTADIEKTLVLGAHGPKELIIFVLRN